MCTLIVLHRCTPGAPLVIAANRDEYFDRPAERPDLRVARSLPVAAPRDLRAGGTWLGVNATGLFAAITNRPSGARNDAHRSRGHVVFDALEACSAQEAADAMRALPRDSYNPFNLLVADGRDAFVVVYEESPRLVELSPGAHVIGNADPDDRSVPKVARILEKARHIGPFQGEKLHEALASICRGHDGQSGPLEDTCIHTERYGTRSSALLCLGAGAEPAWWFADGPPCRTRYEDFTFLLSELTRGGEQGTGEPLARSMV